MKVALFIPCLTEHLYPDSGLAMVKVLKHLGIKIEYVENQTCCGQPGFNSGYRKEIIPAAEHFISLFKDKEYIVAPSGSCVAMVRVYYDQLAVKKKLQADLAALKNKIFEFTEFLVDVCRMTDLGGYFPHRVTYHDSCHLNRILGIRRQPRELIKNINGIDFVEMKNAADCCGFGGTFSYKFKNISLAMVKAKCENITATRAEYCIGADSGCLMNIEGYLRKQQMPARTMHIASLLAASLEQN